MREAVATLRVEEIWEGEIGAMVEVRGIRDTEIGEDDRVWRQGGTYLVVPWVDGQTLRDSACTATTEWTDDLSVHRPADARTLRPATSGESGTTWPAVALGIAVLAIAGASMLAFRRSRGTSA